MRREKLASIQDRPQESIESSQAEQADVLPLEVEPDPTTWLDHIMDDPVLADDRNEGPNMYGVR